MGTSENEPEEEPGMKTITAKPLAGIHCENCGSPDPATDDGYTFCCNEPTCWGGDASPFGGGDRWAIENDGKVVAVVVGACCGAAADAAVRKSGIETDGAHLDCNDPSCAPHAAAGRRW